MIPQRLYYCHSSDALWIIICLNGISNLKLSEYKCLIAFSWWLQNIMVYNVIFF